MHSIQDWLYLQPAVGTVSRFRNRFIKDLTPQIQERLKEIDEARKELVVKYADKDEEGKTVYLDKDNKETKEVTDRVKVSGTEEFQKEYMALWNEDFVEDITPKNEAEFEATKGLLLNTQESFKGINSVRYDEWCQAFENVTEEVPKEA